MKKACLLLLAACGLAGGYAQDGFTVKAKINNPKQYRICLYYQDAKKWVFDTVPSIENGLAVFRGRVTDPTVASLMVRNNPALSIRQKNGIIPGPALQFFLVNENIDIKGDANTIYMSNVKGGKPNEEWNQIRREQQKITHANWTSQKELYDNFKPGDDSAVFKTMQEALQAGAIKDQALQSDFIKKNPHSMVSLYFLSRKASRMGLDELTTAFNALGDDYKNTEYGKTISGKINSMNATAAGKQAVPIDKTDMNGNRVNLDSLRGKYVLIDFWGSWCGPCRASHPHLKQLYAKYKTQGLEIIGIAEENGTTPEAINKAWKQAVAQDGLTWVQVLNNEGIDKFNAVAAYGVSAFPTKLLLDKDGKIIDRYIGGASKDERLDKKLQELFGN